MTIPFVDANRILAAFCGDNAGMAISKSLVWRLFERELTRLNDLGAFPNVDPPFRGLDVAMEGLTDATGTTFRFFNEATGGPPASEIACFSLEGLRVRISVSLDNHELAVFEIEFDEINGAVLVQDQKLRMITRNISIAPTTITWLWEDNQTLLQHFEVNHKFTQQTWDEFKRRFLPLDSYIAKPIAASICKSVAFPNVLEMFIGVIFHNDFRIGMADELILFSSSSLLNLDQCPEFPTRGEVRVDKQRLAAGVAATGRKDEDRRNDVLDDEAPARRYPSDRLKIPEVKVIESGDVFFFTPVRLLEVNFDGAVKPAVNLSGGDPNAFIFWYYSVMCAPRNLITLSGLPGWPITFELSCPVVYSGQLGAGINLGCVKVEVVSVVCQGHVDPLVIEFRIGFDPTRGEVFFESKVLRCVAPPPHINIDSALIPWPLSEIIEAIFEVIVADVVKGKVTQLLTITRIPLANVSPFLELNLAANGFGGVMDHQRNSTFGVQVGVT